MTPTRVMTTLRRVVRAIAAAMLLTSPLVAQDVWSSLPRDLWIAGYGSSSGIQTIANSGGTTGKADAGRGTSFRLGWSGDSTLSVYLGLDQLTINSRDALLAGPYNARDISVGGRISFPRVGHEHVVPFMEVAVLSRQMNAPLSSSGQVAAGRSQLTVNGWGGAFDAGLSFFVVPGAAIEASGGLTIGPLTDLRVNGVTYWTGSVTAVSARLRAGVALWPMAWLSR